MKFTRILVWLLAGFCSLDGARATILVTAAPYLEIAQRIGGDAVESRVIVPQGVDFHNFEPTAQQIIDLAQAKIWFLIGEPFEARIQTFLQSQNTEMVFVDLKRNLPLLHEKEAHHIGGTDPHIWMSPRLMKIQAHTIAMALEELLPEKKNEIEHNLSSLQDDLDRLENNIAARIAKKNCHYLVSQHPAYGYFCADFHLEQIAIEQHGKEPAPGELVELIERLKTISIKKIFISNPNSAKSASIVAEAVGATLSIHNPYVTDYFSMMQRLGEELQ